MMTPQSTDQPELSVVIVTYQCADHLRACLASLDESRADIDLEVIVVDNASDDGTADVAEERDGVTTLRQAANLGFGRACNIGMDIARGRYILTLNPDCEVPRGVLRACVDEVERIPGTGILTPRIVTGQGTFDRRCRRGFPTAWSVACFLTGLDRVLPGQRARWYTQGHLPETALADVDAVSGAFMLMRADALHEVGGFDQQFFMYAEDIDLCMRFRERGWRVRYWPGATIVHVGSGSGDNGRRTAVADAAAFRTMAPLIRKHRPGLRGAAFATATAVGGEFLLALSRLRRRAYS